MATLHNEDSTKLMFNLNRPLNATVVFSRARPSSEIAVRAGNSGDLDALLSLELRAFSYNQITRRSFLRFLSSSNASVIVAEYHGVFAGYSLVLFRSNSEIARLYSIAVEPARAALGFGSTLLAAAEDAARNRGSKVIRLEVRDSNILAISLYRKFGYAMFDRCLSYYADGGNALRFEKCLRG